MLRLNYCTFEHQNAMFVIIRPSIVQRDLSFSFKIFAFVFQKKEFLYYFFPNLCESFQKKFFFLQICSKRFIIMPMLRSNYCTFVHQNALFLIIRLSIVQRDFSF